MLIRSISLSFSFIPPPFLKQFQWVSFFPFPYKYIKYIDHIQSPSPRVRVSRKWFGNTITRRDCRRQGESKYYANGKTHVDVTESAYKASKTLIFNPKIIKYSPV
jgi:hypothetical protein